MDDEDECPIHKGAGDWSVYLILDDGEVKAIATNVHWACLVANLVHQGEPMPGVMQIGFMRSEFAERAGAHVTEQEADAITATIRRVVLGESTEREPDA